MEIEQKYIYYTDADQYLDGLTGTYNQIKSKVESLRDCNFKDIENIENVAYLEEI